MQKNTFVTIIFLGLFCPFLQANVTVSYQPFESDELVINTNSWKLTASDLEKQGLHSMKVVMTNDSDNPETVILEKQGLPITKLLMHLAFWPGLKDASIFWLSLFIIDKVCAIAVIRTAEPDIISSIITYVSQIASLQGLRNFSDFCIQKKNVLLDVSRQRRWLAHLCFTPFLCLTAYHVCRYYQRYYKELYTSLQKDIMYQTITIAPHTTVHKILIVPLTPNSSRDPKLTTQENSI